jgi:hypothetical protein
MSPLQRATVYFEPEVYKILRLRAMAAHRSMSELVNEAVRTALGMAGARSAGTDPRKKGSSASFDRLVQALKRRRLVRRRSGTPHS